MNRKIVGIGSETEKTTKTAWHVLVMKRKEAKSMKWVTRKELGIFNKNKDIGFPLNGNENKNRKNNLQINTERIRRRQNI